MKIAAFYSSKNGTAKRALEQLADLAPALTLLDLDRLRRPPEPTAFDLVLVGGSIRMGRISRALKKFLKRNEGALLELPLIIFINCVFSENREQYFRDNFSQTLLRHAIERFDFGGEMDIARLSGSDKLTLEIVARQFSSSGRPMATLNAAAIEACAGVITNFKRGGEGNEK